MRPIPPIPPLYFSAEDHKADSDLSKISESDSFYARTVFFERCAVTMRKFLKMKELSVEQREFYEAVALTLQYEDDFVGDFAVEHIAVVAEAVFEQHLLEQGVSSEDYLEAAAYLESVMNAEKGTASTLFETILDAHGHKEYTASVFFVVSDMIDVVNAHSASHAMH